MIFARALLGQELILLGAIGLAMGLIYAYLRWRGQLDLLPRVWLPALLWAIFGPLDALVTIVGTWGDPWAEGNPLVRAWLIWDGWVGQVVYTFLYVLFWAVVVVGLEELRGRVGGIRPDGIGGFLAYLLGAAQLITLYALAVGHLYGFLSWTPYLQPIWPLITYFEVHVPWLFSDSPIGYLLDWGTALGAICTVLHLGIAALLRRMGVQAPRKSQAQALAAQPGQVAER
jgi:hypothetical protein